MVEVHTDNIDQTIRMALISAQQLRTCIEHQVLQEVARPAQGRTGHSSPQREMT